MMAQWDALTARLATRRVAITRALQTATAMHELDQTAAWLAAMEATFAADNIAGARGKAE